MNYRLYVASLDMKSKVVILMIKKKGSGSNLL